VYSLWMASKLLASLTGLEYTYFALTRIFRIIVITICEICPHQVSFWGVRRTKAVYRDFLQMSARHCQEYKASKVHWNCSRTCVRAAIWAREWSPTATWGIVPNVCAIFLKMSLCAAVVRFVTIAKATNWGF
jgi:hypothetical protein